jgi:hypothetical protein
MDYDRFEWLWYVDVLLFSGKVEMTSNLSRLAACFLGAGVIYIDLLVRRLPGKQNFKIENSNGFLSSSLSLSFGVMVGVTCYLSQVLLTN